MTEDEIIEITRGAGGFDATPEFLERFASLVAAKEREACALICDEHSDDPVYCGDAIRARGERA
jgi:hypothetical protein